jgi:two-component system NtrC family sensor kinase
MTSSLDITHVLQILIDGSVSLLNADAGTAVIFDELGVVSSASYRLPGVSLTECGFAQTITSPVIIHDSGSFPGLPDWLLKSGIRSALCIPVDIQEDKKACIGIFTFSGRKFSDNELHIMEILASTVKSAIRNSLFFDMVEKSQKLWTDTFDAIKDLVFVLDEQATIVKTNQAFASYANKHPRDVIGRSFHDIFEGELENKKSIYDIIMSDDEELTSEIDLEGNPYLLSRFPVTIESTVRYTVYVMKNITDLKKLKDQLYHSDKLSSIGMLVSGVAHEINNPLTGILGYTELLQMKNPEGPLKTELEKIYTSAERCKTIVENLLTFSRQRPPHRSLENINDIIDRTVELRIYWLRSNNVIIETKYAEIPYTMLDPQQIQQVILNMLINAEYAVTQVADRRQGSIGIWTGFSPESNEITITMTDNGTGIDEGHLNKIFDPFFSTKPVDKGTGLGLSISHGIIKEHGGEIEVHSRKDEYTTFIIRMPVDKKVTE